ncbi:MAG: multidrug effflux MFS transporter [Candidatus Dormibacteraceae bacterium]
MDWPLRLRRYLLLAGLSMMGPLSIDTYLPAFPTIARDFHVQPSQIQVTLSACMVGLAAGQVLAGPLSDTIGRRLPLLIGMAGFTGGSLLCAFAPSPFPLTALRLLQGLGGAAGIVIASAVVRDLYSGTALARFFSLLMLVSGLGPIAAPIVGGQLLRFTSWHGIFLGLALVGLVLFVGSARWLPETLPLEHRREGSLRKVLATFGSLLSAPDFLAPALASGLATSVVFAYIAASPFVFQVLYGVSPQAFSLIFATNAFGVIVMSQINGRLVGRIQPHRLFVLGLIISGIGSLALLLVVVHGHLPLLALAIPLFFIVSTVGLTSPNGNAMALAGHPREAGSGAALLGLFRFGSGALVAPLVGLGGSHTALPMAVVMAGISLSASLIFFFLGSGRWSGRGRLQAPSSAPG